MKLALKYPISLVNQITESLTNAIIEGELSGGQRLVESNLQKKFKVSRAPIRESLCILESLGLLVNIPRKGRIVRKVDKKDVEENFIIRVKLEALAARFAVCNIRPEDIKGMEMALSRMQESLKKEDFRSYFKYHYDFHEIFIRASKKDTLIGILGSLRRQGIWFRYVLIPVATLESYEKSIRIHRKILDLFVERDTGQLESLMESHILSAMEEVLQLLEMKNTGNAE